METFSETAVKLRLLGLSRSSTLPINDANYGIASKVEEWATFVIDRPRLAEPWLSAGQITRQRREI
jgi:hypothetical protein